MLKSFLCAFSGIFQAIKKERNLKIHLLAAILVILAGFYFQVSYESWLALVMIISLIIAAEIFNSSIENLCNLLKEKLNLSYEETRLIRNLSAGAVLILALGSIVVGMIIFLPYLIP